MSKPTLDYFTPQPAARSPLGMASLLLGLAACTLVAVPYVLGSRIALVCLPLAVFTAIAGICIALDNEDLERRSMAPLRFLGMAASAVALLAAAGSLVFAIFVIGS
jgi:hypothetical protein